VMKHIISFRIADVALGIVMETESPVKVSADDPELIY